MTMQGLWFRVLLLCLTPTLKCRLGTPTQATFLRREGSGLQGSGLQGLGVVCEPRRPGLVGPPGFHTTAREPKCAHLRVPVFKNTTKIPRKDPKREEEERKLWREEGKKFWAPHPAIPTLRGPTFGASTIWGLHPSRPHSSPPFGPHPSWSQNSTSTNWPKSPLAEVELAELENWPQSIALVCATGSATQQQNPCALQILDVQNFADQLFVFRRGVTQRSAEDLDPLLFRREPKVPTPHNVAVGSATLANVVNLLLPVGVTPALFQIRVFPWCTSIPVCNLISCYIVV